MAGVKPPLGSAAVDEAVVDGVEREFETVGDAEFVENIVQVIFDPILPGELGGITSASEWYANGTSLGYSSDT